MKKIGLIKQKTKLRSINYWTGVYLSSIKNIDIQSMGPTSQTYHHVTIEEDLTFTSVRTKFHLTDINNGIFNPELRIYTVSGFNNTPTLIYNSLLEYTSNSSSETKDYYTPTNNRIDGFCEFQIWSNGIHIYTFPNHYLVLQRKQTNTTYNNNLYVYYAKSFFYNHSLGVSYSESYVTNLIMQYNQIWQKLFIHLLGRQKSCQLSNPAFCFTNFKRYNKFVHHQTKIPFLNHPLILCVHKSKIIHCNFKIYGL